MTRRAAEREVEIVPPDSLLMESLRAVGYSFRTAVADLIDNSLAVGATKISIHMESNEEDYFALLDNGSGMSKDELRTAMKMAGRSVFVKRATGDLGRFGLGLKTASFSQARRLTVVTKKNGLLTGAAWDLDSILESGKWGLEWLGLDEVNRLPQVKALKEYPSGTVVIWHVLDLFFSDVTDKQKHLARELKDAADHLSLVFHRFLQRNLRSVSIFLNGSELKPYDPFLESSPQGVQPQPEEIYKVEGTVVRVKPYILPPISKMTHAQRQKALFDESARESQGFYIYRSDRLLAWGNWYRITLRRETSKLARIKVDTSPELDRLWKLGIMKSEVTPPHSLVQALKPVVDRFVERAIRVSGGQSKNIVSDKNASWIIRSNADGTLDLAINEESPVFLRLRNSLSRELAKPFALFVESLVNNFPAQVLYHRLANDEKLNAKDFGLTDLEEYFLDLQGNFAVLGLESSQLLELISTLEPFSSTPQGAAFIQAKRQQC